MYYKKCTHHLQRILLSFETITHSCLQVWLTGLFLLLQANRNQISDEEQPLLIWEELHLVVFLKFEIKINLCWSILWWCDQIRASWCFHCSTKKLLKYTYFYWYCLVLQSSKRKTEQISSGGYRITGSCQRTG